MLNTQPAPHIRYHESARVLMWDAVAVLLIVYAMAFFYYGARAVALGAWSVGMAAASDVACTLIARRKVNVRDFSPIVTGLILPLMMPASIPFYVVTVAAVFAMVVAKHPFGGVGHNVFNPAAAGFCFVSICYGDLMFTYPAAAQKLPVFLEDIQWASGISPSMSLSLGAVPQYDLVDMALGKYPGPMGATNILVILACLLYLVFRNTVNWKMPVSFFTTVALLGLLFPRASFSRGESVLFELMSGLLLFGGVFLLGDPVTTPKRDLSKLAFGVVAGILVMLYRLFGKLEEGFPFAILIMNAAVWAFDMLGERFYSKLRRRRVENITGKKVQKKA